MIQGDATIRVERSMVLGTVAELKTKRIAQRLLDPILAYAAQPEPEERHAFILSESALDSVRLVVLTEQRVNNPPFYGALVQMGFSSVALPDFAHMAPITLVDTVTFAFAVD